MGATEGRLETRARVPFTKGIGVENTAAGPVNVVVPEGKRWVLLNAYGYDVSFAAFTDTVHIFLVFPTAYRDGPAGDADNTEFDSGYVHLIQSIPYWDGAAIAYPHSLTWTGRIDLPPGTLIRFDCAGGIPPSNMALKLIVEEYPA